MITPPLTPALQEQFDDLLYKMDALMDDMYTLERDTFMNEPLRYSQTVFYPIYKPRKRASVRADLETVLSLIGASRRVIVEGKGVYMTDNYTVGNFVVYIACARRGGNLIGFKLAA